MLLFPPGSTTAVEIGRADAVAVSSAVPRSDLGLGVHASRRV
jgi:hypothetical protein